MTEKLVRPTLGAQTAEPATWIILAGTVAVATDK